MASSLSFRKPAVVLLLALVAWAACVAAASAAAAAPGTGPESTATGAEGASQVSESEGSKWPVGDTPPTPNYNGWVTDEYPVPSPPPAAPPPPIFRGTAAEWQKGTYINCGSQSSLKFRNINKTLVSWEKDDHFVGGMPVTMLDSSIPRSWDAATVEGSQMVVWGEEMGDTVVSGTKGNMGKLTVGIVPSEVFATARYFGGEKDEVMAYAIPVPETGRYWVRLYFFHRSETTPASLNRFNVYVQGAKVLSDYSPPANVGSVIEFLTPADGKLIINFERGSMGIPFVNAIAVVRAPEGMYNLTYDYPIVFVTEYRVAAAAQWTVQDMNGRLWADDTPFAYPKHPYTVKMDYSDALVRFPGLLANQNTLPDLLPLLSYAGIRAAQNLGAFPGISLAYPYVLYTFNVVPNTAHRIRMGFTEHFRSGEKERLVDLYVDGKMVLEMFDIFAEGGSRRPLIKEFNVRSNSSGKLTVMIKPNSLSIAQSCQFNYVEVFQVTTTNLTRLVELMGNEASKILPQSDQAAAAAKPPAVVAPNSAPTEASTAAAGTTAASGSTPPPPSSSLLWEGFSIGVAVGAIAVTLMAIFALLLLRHHHAKLVAATAASADAGSRKEGSEASGKQSTLMAGGDFLYSFVTGGHKDGKGADKLNSSKHLSVTGSSSLDNPRTGLYGAAVFPLSDLSEGTSGFSREFLLGQGGFGKVYKAILPGSGFEVAVKRLEVGSQQGVREFMTEVQLLSRLHHKNLVNLLGYCDEDRQLMLVYEYAAKGTLKDYLRDAHKASQLTWEKRLRIAAGAARGIEYLHNGASPPVIHRDIKTSNILLDAHFNAKVADFGLSKLGKKQAHDDKANTSHISTKVKGTLGYLDPVYYTKQHLTVASDVYSFGVVLLELLTGRLPIWVEEESGPGYQQQGESLMNLVEWAQPFLESGEIAPILAPTIDINNGAYDSLRLAAKLALKCVSTLPKNRPTMSEVVRTLTEAKAALDEAGPAAKSSASSAGNGSVSVDFDCSINVPLTGTTNVPIMAAAPVGANADSFSVSILPPLEEK